tara:strand:+ start:413 stop:733 length:321 start_codon:yes stop_codon:yes gene_type:complete
MSTLIKASIKASELKKIDPKKVIRGEKDNYIPVTISVNDESRFGKNVSISVDQTEEERADESSIKHYLGNGSVIWTDGIIKKGEKNNEQSSSNIAKSNNNDSDMPF